MLKMLLREPLLHFMLAGVLLFAVFNYWSAEAVNDERLIVVNNERLLTFVQYRYRQISRQDAKNWLAQKSSVELQKIIDQYVLEESLYREAKALNLDKGDYAGRRRLINQLEYINQGFIYDTLKLSEADLKAHYNANQSRYYAPPTVTFTHVFFNLEQHGEEVGQRLASKQLEYLNQNKVAFQEAISLGDRFLYHRYYANKNQEEIASHFGSSMAAEVFKLPVDETQWIGPFASEYGYHLVMVANKTAGYLPPLDEIRQQVESDTTVAKVQQKLAMLNQSVAETYRVVVADDVEIMLSER